MDADRFVWIYLLEPFRRQFHVYGGMGDMAGDPFASCSRPFLVAEPLLFYGVYRRGMVGDAVHIAGAGNTGADF